MMITAALIAFPFLAALLLFAVGNKNARRVALVFALAEFALSVFAVSRFYSEEGVQFLINKTWISSLGISFKVGMDGVSLLLVLLTTFLVPLIILSSFRSERKNAALFYALILFMQGGLVGVFTALDGFLFYIFWEIALIPIYLLCLFWGGEKRIAITFKFFIYTLTGSLLMLGGLIYLYLHTPGSHSFDIDALYAVKLGAKAQNWLFWCMFLAFAIKMPVFPFHTWQPDTYTDAPSEGTMLLSGIMLKMGVYGLIRWLLPLAPLGVQEWGMTAVVLSVIGIVYASFIAWMQNDFKRLIAYSSIAHVGLISAGIFSHSLQGLQGAMIQMLSHGINVVGLFFVAEIISQRSGTREMDQLGGIRNEAPWFSTAFLIVLLASVALPLTNGFVGEFMLLWGLFEYNVWISAIAGLTIIFGAVYMLGAFQKIMLGEKKNSFADLVFSEKAVFIPIIVMIFWIGLYPKPFLNIAEPALKHIAEQCAAGLK